jgi:hypothetical protein
MHAPSCIFWANRTPFSPQGKETADAVGAAVARAPQARTEIEARLAVRARPGRLSALSISHSKSVFYGVCMGARDA